MSEDVYAWHDPFVEIEQERRRADRSYDLGYETGRQKTMGVLGQAAGEVLRDMWRQTAHMILRDVVKPYAHKHGDQAVSAISDCLRVDAAERWDRETVTVFVGTIEPIRIQADYDARSLRRG